MAKLITIPVGYAIDATEVTRDQYTAWLATSPSLSALPERCTSWKTTFSPGCGSTAHPVACVDWCDAYGYCKGVGKRLCGKIGGESNATKDYKDATLSQWYNACSSGGQLAYPYGNSYDPQACHGVDSVAAGCKACKSVPTGSLASCQSAQVGYEGVYDLSGNLLEWEDSCDDASTVPKAYNDNCRNRGGSFSLGNTGESVRCDADGMGMRSTGGDVSKAVALGFRCCAP